MILFSLDICFRTNCTVNRDVLCLGRRRFLKRLRCNWTGGHRWSTALILSITLGGFGIDRYVQKYILSFKIKINFHHSKYLFKFFSS